jgi:hypothetical protein
VLRGALIRAVHKGKDLLLAAGNPGCQLTVHQYDRRACSPHRTPAFFPRRPGQGSAV